MPMKMRWGKEVALRDVGYLDEFTMHRSEHCSIEEHSRFRRVFNVLRVGLCYNKRGAAVSEPYVAVANSDGRVSLFDQTCTVHLIKYYEEPIVQTITVEKKGARGPFKPKKKRR